MFDAAAIAAQLRTAPSVQDAKQLVSGLKVGELKQVGAAAGCGTVGTRRDEIAAWVVRMTAGIRLAHQAILGH